MGFLTSDNYRQRKTKTLQRVDVTAAQTIEGDNVVWNISSVAGGAFDLTVADYDPSRLSAYDPEGQVCIIVKCSANCGANNVSILSSDGAGGTTTHYTFAADYSVTPRYVVLRKVEGKNLWEVA